MFNKIYYLGNTDIEDPKDEKAIHKLMANMSAVSYFLAIIELLNKMLGIDYKFVCGSGD